MRTNASNLHHAIREVIYRDCRHISHEFADAVSSSVASNVYVSVLTQPKETFTRDVRVKFSDIARLGDWSYKLQCQAGERCVTAWFGWVSEPIGFYDVVHYAVLATFDGERERRQIFVTRENERRLLDHKNIYLGNFADVVTLL